MVGNDISLPQPVRALQRWSRVLIVSCALLALPASAYAQEQDADALLKKIDDANNPFKDRRYTMKMDIREADGSSRVVLTKVAERGSGRQRFVLYKAPADVKGMGVLVHSRNSLYIYMPSYSKVRRVAMHARKQAFMGSDFTLDDSAQLRYAPDYAPKLISNEGGKVRLELTPRPGKDLAYTKITLTADTSTWLIDALEYYDDRGLAKTEARSQVSKVGGKPMQHHIEMKDVRTNHSTIVDVSDVEVNVGLKKRLFTKRGLSRGKL